MNNHDDKDAARKIEESRARVHTAVPTTASPPPVPAAIPPSMIGKDIEVPNDRADVDGGACCHTFVSDLGETYYHQPGSIGLTAILYPEGIDAAAAGANAATKKGGKDTEAAAPPPGRGGAAGYWSDASCFVRMIIVVASSVLLACLVLLIILLGTGGSGDGANKSVSDPSGDAGETEHEDGGGSGGGLLGTLAPTPSPVRYTNVPTLRPTTPIPGGEVGDGNSNTLPTSMPSMVQEELREETSPYPSASQTMHPTSLTRLPTNSPTVAPSSFPSLSPSRSPTKIPTSIPTHMPASVDNSPGITSFYLMGGILDDPDVSPSQLPTLLSEVLTPSDDDGETWLMYLGNFNDLPTTNSCPESSYSDFDNVLQQSSIPVFVLPGPNEWNGCPDTDQAWDYWTSTFGGEYNTKHWSPPHGYSVSRQVDGTIHNFSFAYRRVLHVGLNLVGGFVHDGAEWDVRLAANLEWISDRVEAHRTDVDVVIIYGNQGMNPGAGRRNRFYNDLSGLVESTIQIPTMIVYNRFGAFDVEENALGVSNFIMMNIQGHLWPPMKLTVDTISGTFLLEQGDRSESYVY